MDITKFIVEGRDKAKLYGDYAHYRRQLSHKVHNLRKKLGIATKPRAKYAAKAPISAEDIGQTTEYVHLLLLTSERAWANAQSMREVHSAEQKGITGSTRKHIITRLNKSTIYASELCRLLADRASTGSSDIDLLEARAYAASLLGAKEFEKGGWQACVESYSEARIIYSALLTATRDDVFKDLLSDPIDVSIRYGAYQMKLPRTIAVPVIARKHFPSDANLVAQVQKLDPDVLKDQPLNTKAEASSSVDVPGTITWRSRTVPLEDAAIATALGSVHRAAQKLSEALGKASHPKDKATAYDDILIASQDTVDATKHAIDELVSEGVGQGDKRIQSLQVTRTAVSYDMVSWRIGRDRVLVGENDGSTTPIKKQKMSGKEEGTGRKLAHLREQAVLYNSILQSLDTIKELPGVAADLEFLEEVDAKYCYFQALKCLTVARSHTLLSNPKNALALLNRAFEKCSIAHSFLTSAMDTSDSSPPNIGISPSQAQALFSLLQSELQRSRALVELSNITSKSARATTDPSPLIGRLHTYPAHEINLRNLVTYPPKLEAAPVKPLFFDAAWNYIEYPGRQTAKPVQARGQAKESSEFGEAQNTQQKKGWFGFGR